MNAFKGFLDNKYEAGIQLLLLLGIFISVNMLANEMVIRFDLTENNRYTLSEASREIAENVESPITVTAYFSDDLPPQLSTAKDEFQNFLEEFRAYSDGNLEYRFVNPNEDEESEKKAQQAGVRPVTLDVRKRDQISQKRAYLGAVFRFGEKKEVLPVIQPGASLEYNIASTVKQLTVERKPKIGLLQGHGEPNQKSMNQLTSQLNKRYNVVNVTGIDTAGVPADVEVLMVVKPDRELSTDELVAIDQYLMSGGRALFAINRIKTQVQQGRATVLNSGIEKLLASYNIPVNANLVRDMNSSNIRVRQQRGMFSVVNQVRYPYIPQVSNFSDHPITEGLETSVFQFISSIDTTAVDTSRQDLTVLARSSRRTGQASRQPFNLDPMQEWQQKSFNQPNLPLGALVEGRFTSAYAGTDTLDVSRKESVNTSIVVFGDGDFIVNGNNRGGRRQGQQQRLPKDNINLAVNSVDWLADDTGLIALRTKGVTNRPLKTIEDGTKTLLKYLNTFLPILFVLGIGLYRYQRQKARRTRWIQEGV